MGQQQLLLLVLATVIVGLATVAGIQAFDQGQVQSTQDALTQQAVSIASDIQAQVKKPSQFGGHDGSLSDASGNITLPDMGYETDGDNLYQIPTGQCGFLKGGSNNPGSANSGASGGGTIDVVCESTDAEVVAQISGLNSDEITTSTDIDRSTDLEDSGP